ncbi:YybH family protein [Novilysobacter spongiicola]|uniref:Ketosteroid isomerase homolog n=1 Tax=Lysobacter spongiicola DSM 21749 TaxID=1122188 RepID=A0A1T4M580_9GAMM|nr:nuclear transport factor 2 family protein [Lysobacter spongiicola]SJZ62159.1 Ketosteroid isomerase homolog [Lysobacter spongiicola DSM 21749]
MKNLMISVAIAMTLSAAPALAHEKAQAAPAAAAPAADPALAEATAVVERFGTALKSGDMATVGTLLDENVLILESGGAERSREEYLGHHAISDAAFLGKATVTPVRRQGWVRGDVAFVGSESEIKTGEGSQAKTLLSTETMLLQKQDGNWQIVHIHWSSRPKKAAKS